MVEIKSDRKYAETHEWCLVQGGVATVGISDYAQTQLGDVVFVDLPSKGKKVKQGEDAGTVESSKAVGELKSPVSGEVIEVNAKVADAPETINTSPFGDGWLFKVKMSDASEVGKLLDADKYKGLCK